MVHGIRQSVLPLVRNIKLAHRLIGIQNQCTSFPCSSPYLDPRAYSDYKKLSQLLGNLRHLCSDTQEDVMEISNVVRRLESFTPSSLAGSWDNVGLLVEPTRPHKINSMLLTNDLMEPVMQEAIEKKVNLVLSYHPPIFKPLTRLTQRSWKERIVVKCAEYRIALYSPHTSYDAVTDGTNDWLVSPFSGVKKPIEPVDMPYYPTTSCNRVDLCVPADSPEVHTMLHKMDGVSVMEERISEAGKHYTVSCTTNGLPALLREVQKYPDVLKTVQFIKLDKPPLPDHGPGRIVKLTSPVTISEAVDTVKSHLGLSHIRLALALEANMDSTVKTLAVCAGSGGSVLHGVEADLYITGEMSHHEVLDATHRHSSVILCDHSNTERGFLRHWLQPKLTELLENKVEVLVSECDKDPLSIR